MFKQQRRSPLTFYIMILIQNRILINKPDYPENGEKFTHEIKVLDGIVCINSLDELKQDDNIILGFDEWEIIKEFIENQIKIN